VIGSWDPTGKLGDVGGSGNVRSRVDFEKVLCSSLLFVLVQQRYLEKEKKRCPYWQR